MNICGWECTTYLVLIVGYSNRLATDADVVVGLHKSQELFHEYLWLGVHRLLSINCWLFKLFGHEYGYSRGIARISRAFP